MDTPACITWLLSEGPAIYPTGNDATQTYTPIRTYSFLSCGPTYLRGPQRMLTPVPEQRYTYVYSPPGPSVPIIIGGVVGGISTILLLVLGIIYLRRRRKAPNNNSDIQITCSHDQKGRRTPVELCPDAQVSELCSSGRTPELQQPEDLAPASSMLYKSPTATAPDVGCVGQLAHSSELSRQSAMFPVSELPGSDETEGGKGLASKLGSQGEGVDDGCAGTGTAQ
jgi:hypothetical protein